jgi:carbon storage regulator
VVIGDPGNPIGIVRVASVKGDRVRLAFEFPRHIPVNRRELAEEKLAAEPVPAIAGMIRPTGEA